jgi:plastocyanin
MLVLLVALIAAAGIPVACERTPPANSASAPPKVVTVAIRDFKFEPATVTVHEGDTVEWKNDDSVPHTATADGGVQEATFDSGSIRTGAAWRYIAGKKGTYNYTCTFHPKMIGKKMIGKLIVE